MQKQIDSLRKKREQENGDQDGKMLQKTIKLNGIVHRMH